MNNGPTPIENISQINFVLLTTDESYRGTTSNYSGIIYHIGIHRLNIRKNQSACLYMTLKSKEMVLNVDAFFPNLSPDPDKCHLSFGFDPFSGMWSACMPVKEAIDSQPKAFNFTLRARFKQPNIADPSKIMERCVSIDPMVIIGEEDSGGGPGYPEECRRFRVSVE